MPLGGRFQYDQDDDDSDAEFVEDEDDGSIEVGRHGARSGAGYGGFMSRSGGGGGFMSGGSRGGLGGGDPYAFDMDGGGGDYAFPLEFSKPAPFSADGLDLDGNASVPKRGGGTTGLGMGAATGALARGVGNSFSQAASKAAAKASSAPSTIGGLTGKKTTSGMDIDSRFNLSKFERKPAGGVSSAAAGGKAKPDDSAAAFQKFLDDTDEESNDEPPPRKNVETPARASTAGAARQAPNAARSDSMSPPPIVKEAALERNAPRRSDRSDTSSESAPATATKPSVTGGSVAKAALNESASPFESPTLRSRARSGSPAPSNRSRNSGSARERYSSLGSQRSDKSPASLRSKHSAVASPRSSPHSSPRSRDSSPHANVFGNVMQASDFFAQNKNLFEKEPATQTVGAKHLLEPPAPTVGSSPSSLASANIVPRRGVGAGAAAPEEASVSQQHASATYEEDFVGESTGTQLKGATYDDDFEDSKSSDEGKHSRSVTDPVSKMTVTIAPTTVRSDAVQAPAADRTAGASVIRSVPRTARHDDSDDDYRPRRPTCHVGIQANIPVDVGVQCDPLPEPQGLQASQSDPWTHPLGFNASGPCPGPFGPQYTMPHPNLNPYAMPLAPFWGGGHMSMTAPFTHGFGAPMGPLGPQNLMASQQQQPQQQIPAMGQSAMRQLFATALGGDHRPFFPPSRRPAWEPKAMGSYSAAAAVMTPDIPGNPTTSFTAGAAPNSARAVAPSSTADVSQVGCEGSTAAAQLPPRAGALSTTASSVEGLAALLGDGAHGLHALSLVDESVREQIEKLRQAAARHRELLEASHARTVPIGPATPVPAPMAASGTDCVNSDWLMVDARRQTVPGADASRGLGSEPSTR